MSRPNDIPQDDRADEIDDAVVYRPKEVPEDVWQAARRQWQCEPSDTLGYRQPESNVGQQRLLITARAIMAERERCAKVVEDYEPSVACWAIAKAIRGESA